MQHAKLQTWSIFCFLYVSHTFDYNMLKVPALANWLGVKAGLSPLPGGR